MRNPIRSIFILILTLIAICVFDASNNELKAQKEASFILQKNMIERIQRLDQYIGDTVPPDFKTKFGEQYQRLINFRDSVVVFQKLTKKQYLQQDSVFTLISDSLLNQISQLQSRNKKHIDEIAALNWQVKSNLQLWREETEKRQELETENTDLVKENEYLKALNKAHQTELNALKERTAELERMLTKLYFKQFPEEAVVDSVSADSLNNKPR